MSNATAVPMPAVALTGTTYIGMEDRGVRSCIDGVPIIGEVDTTLYLDRGCISVRAIQTGQLSSMYDIGSEHEYTLRDTPANTHTHAMRVRFDGRVMLGDIYYYHFSIIEA